MNLLTRGLLSATIAGLLLALLLWIQGETTQLPTLDLIGLLARVLGEQRDAAWALYGAVMLAAGLALPVLADEDGRGMAPALGLAGTGWFATMMALLPMAGFSPFGLGSSWAVPLLTFAQAAVFGLALGWLVEHLPRRGVAEAAAPATAAEPLPVADLARVTAPQPAMARVRAADGAATRGSALRAARTALVTALQRVLAATAGDGPRQTLPSGRA